MQAGETMSPKLAVFALVLLAVVVAAECVRAGGDRAEATFDAVTASDFVAAELDPVFMQKLADRMRAPYVRAHRASVLARY